MRILNWEITRKAQPQTLSTVTTGGSWWSGFPFIIREADSGDWQKNIIKRPENVLMNSSVFACVSLIAGDIAKMPFRLMQKAASGIWQETQSSSYSPVLAQPNTYQNEIQFREAWAISKLTRGNTYVLLGRDNRNVVVNMWVLDPQRVTVTVSDDGQVFYELATDNLAGIEDVSITVPASEIIHDRWNTFFHPLIGLPPLYAAAMPAIMALKGQYNTKNLFENAGLPSGILTAPGPITQAKATEVSEFWKANFSGSKAGRVAVVGDGLTFNRISGSNADAQLMDLLKWSAEQVAACFHVPAYKIGAAAAPAYNNIEGLTQDYYQNALQILVQSMERLLTDGLRAGPYQVNMDENVLLRMDTASLYESISKGIGGGFLAPNEGRARLNLKPLKGGDTVFLQQQYYSLAELADRAANPPAPVADTPPPPDDAANKEWYADVIKLLRAEAA